jgi:hypothetical protein
MVAAERLGHGAAEHRALAARVDRLEDLPPIRAADVDLSVANRHRLRSELAEVFEYFAAVEGDVAQNALDIAALLPRMCECERRFLAVWSAHEAAHSNVFDELRRLLDLEPVAQPPSPKAGRLFRSMGAATRLPAVHDALKLVYLTRGAMHEHLTHDAYRLLARRLADLGEPGLARSVALPIRRQEAAHLGYYRVAARLQRSRMSAEAIAWARLLSVKTYAPVGATRRSRRAICGRVFASLAGAAMAQTLAPVQELAEALLGNGRDRLPPFVSRAMHRCLDRTAATAPGAGRTPTPAWTS